MSDASATRLEFSRSLYSETAVQEAVSAYAQLAVFHVEATEHTVSVDQLTSDGGVTLPISPPVRADDPSVQIEITNESRNFVLLTSARLSVAAAP